MDHVEKCEVEKLVRDGYTYEQISGELRRHCPEIQRGLSSRRYCKKHSMKRLVGTDLEEVVEKAVSKVTSQLLYNYNYTLLKIGCYHYTRLEFM